ncbi:MAG: Slp family lipoprotein, partial [bacterium]
MKKIVLILLTFLLFACTPVIHREFLDEAVRDVSLSQLEQEQDLYKGKLFVIGGIIVKTKATNEGSLIEAIYVPVNNRGYLKDVESPSKRFLALFPKAAGFLDPAVYSKGRQVTIASEFVEMRPGKIDEMDYPFPFFTIKQIYLWPEERYYYGAPPYPYWYDPWYPYTPYYPYGWYDPW